MIHYSPTFSEPNASTPSAGKPAQTPSSNAVKPSAPSKPNTAPSKPAPTPAKPAPSQPKPAPQAPVHTHTWVHHPAVDEKGHHEEIKQIVTEPHAICGGCGKDFGPGPAGANAAGEHLVDSCLYGPCQNYSSKYVKVEKVVGHRWVVDVPGRPAYDQCSGCGARK